MWPTRNEVTVTESTDKLQRYFKQIIHFNGKHTE